MRSTHEAARAFTLLELLIAMAVGAVVLIVIQTTYFGALRLHNTTHEKLDEQTALDQALSIIRRDLSGVVLPGGTLSGQLQTENFSSFTTESYGDRVGPDLFTNTGRIDAWSPFSDVQMVTYYLGTPDATTTNGTSKPGNTLRRVVTRNLLPVQEPEPEEQVLLEGVASASLSFFDGSEWTDTWDSVATSTLPRAIKFSLVLAPRDPSQPMPDPVDLVVPLPVRTVTGQAAEDEEAAGSE